MNYKKSSGLRFIDLKTEIPRVSSEASLLLAFGPELFSGFVDNNETINSDHENRSSIYTDFHCSNPNV